MKTFISLIALLVVALADNAPYRPAPSFIEEPIAHQYQYPTVDDVKDSFAQNEVRNNYATNHVTLLTDNTHIANNNAANAQYGYLADAYSRYLAEVGYGREPKYEFYAPVPVSSKRTPSKHAPYPRTPYRRAPYQRTPYNRAPHSN
ncbi:uncharacterized protein LOC131890417 [Tigriopus californicus]|uniref:uncharacterized protein LOC131890417 n=1 Tax=Tigriopus californicus TaxID=6832 RepID=UPI0027DA1399|nr:uncharacterized protein LOC131890417 [Tigriopus californicus]|eukprot:TCALIF_13557-PA protein Name:"Protein of unknown function" AED:0.08 eAED:0.12 QI:301/1/0.5/1/1/1/2/0/145